MCCDSEAEGAEDNIRILHPLVVPHCRPQTVSTFRPLTLAEE